MDHSAVVIDGAYPRSQQERVSRLLDYATVELDKAYKRHTWDTFPIELYKKYFDLEAEYRDRYKEDDFEWNEMEDEVIELITDLLPSGWICELAENDPGTVIVTELERDDD